MILSEAAQAVINAVVASLGPSPPENLEAGAKIKALIETYNQRYEKETNAPIKRPGLNMILPREVVGDDVVTVHGHVPGVKPGDRFKDRGQLYVAGLHATLMKGIHAPGIKHTDFTKGAYSVVMSGGYVDDEDMGESFWYTGEGRIDSSSKGKNQSMERGSNAALRNNYMSQTPVRVIRGFISSPGDGDQGAGPSRGSEEAGGEAGAGRKKKEKGFVYEGLYVVLEHKLEASKDGPLVCKFLMQGVPGHSVVNTKVEFGIFGGVSHGSRLHSRRLAVSQGTSCRGSQPNAKRLRTQRDKQMIDTARKLMLVEIRKRYRTNPDVLLSEDISGGSEPVPIPLVNEVDSETLPPNFQYIHEYTWAPGVQQLVSPVLRFTDEEMAEFTLYPSNRHCGLAFNRMIAAKDRKLASEGGLPEGYEPHLEEQYNSAGSLLVTDPCGIHECGPACTSAKCKLNKQVTNGLYLPLEVFKTHSKGWGVRCRERIPAGAFVCCYVGQLLSDHLAERRKGADHYLFNLDFFAHIYTEISEKGLVAIEQEIPLHKIPPVLPITAIREVQLKAAQQARARKLAQVTAAEDAAAAAAVVDPPAATTASDAIATIATAVPDSAAAATDVSTVAVPGTSQPPEGDSAVYPGPGDLGVLDPDAVRMAALDLLSSYNTVANLEVSYGGNDGADTSGPDVSTSQPSVYSEAVAMAAASAKDPGAFYLQHIIGREELMMQQEGEDAGWLPQLIPRTGIKPVMAAVAVDEEEEYAPVLVLDARSCGNVGRFINHSCDGNLTIQAVFAGSCRNTFLYHVALFACVDIPAMTELTYNYGYHLQAARDGQYGMECHCGAPNCVGLLM